MTFSDQLFKYLAGEGIDYAIVVTLCLTGQSHSGIEDSQRNIHALFCRLRESTQAIEPILDRDTGRNAELKRLTEVAREVLRKIAFEILRTPQRIDIKQLVANFRARIPEIESTTNIPAQTEAVRLIEEMATSVVHKAISFALMNYATDLANARFDWEHELIIRQRVGPAAWRHFQMRWNILSEVNLVAIKKLFQP